MSRNGSPEELEAEVLRHMPADVMHALQQNDRREPAVKHLVQSAITRFVTDIDRRTLEVLTAKILAGTAAVKAATQAKRAVHDLTRVKEELRRDDGLKELRHETRTLEECERQQWLRQGTLRRRYFRAKLKANIARLQEVFIRREEPAPRVVSTWDQLLGALTDGITGGEDFRARSEQFLEDYAARRRAAVREDDPRREERLAAIDALVEDLRSRRDRMLWDRWNLKQ